eukprot:5505635-Prymnesium_polylepis.1
MMATPTMIWLGGMAPPPPSGPTSCLPTEPCVHIKPWTSSAGINFLKLTILTPNDQPFSTLRVALATDADV